MRTVGAFEAKTHLSALLDWVTRGEEVLITRHGHPVARRVPAGMADREQVSRAIAKLKSLAKGHSLGGLSWKELRDEGRRWADSRAKRNGLSEADLHVLAKLFEQRLERGEEAEALPGREVVGEDDLLQLGVAERVEVEVPGQVAP